MKKGQIAASLAIGAGTVAGAYAMYEFGESRNSLPAEEVMRAESTVAAVNLNLSLTISQFPDCQRAVCEK